MAWAKSLSDLRPYVRTLREEFAELATKELPTPIMHRDLDPKNMLAGGEGEVVPVDWKYVGPRLLASELLDAALSFAGATRVATRSGLPGERAERFSGRPAIVGIAIVTYRQGHSAPV